MLFVLAERLKYQQKRKRWSRCSISMGLLLAAAFLSLSCAFSSSGVPRQSHLLNRHTAAPQRAREGARGGQRKDECNPRQFRETLVSSLEDMGLPHFGARSHLLLDAEIPNFLVQDDLQALSGEAKGDVPCGLGHPNWVVGRGGGRGLVALLPLLASTALIPLPRCLTCDFIGIPGCILMNSELLSPCGQLPFPAMTPPSALGERARWAGAPISLSYINVTTAKKRFH